MKNKIGFFLQFPQQYHQVDASPSKVYLNLCPESCFSQVGPIHILRQNQIVLCSSVQMGEEFHCMDI